MAPLRSAPLVAAASAQGGYRALRNSGDFALLRQDWCFGRTRDRHASRDLHTWDLASTARRERLDGRTTGEILRAPGLGSGRSAQTRKVKLRSLEIPSRTAAAPILTLTIDVTPRCSRRRSIGCMRVIRNRQERCRDRSSFRRQSTLEDFMSAFISASTGPMILTSGRRLSGRTNSRQAGLLSIAAPANRQAEAPALPTSGRSGIVPIRPRGSPRATLPPASAPLSAGLR